MNIHVPKEILTAIRSRIIIPLKDAMRVTEYKEHDRNYKFYVKKKIKGSKQLQVLRPYSFKIKGTLKHEMYLKPVNPSNIRNILGDEFNYRLIMKPNKSIDLEFDSKNKRTIELVVFFKK